jgi:hypothetical protein
MQRTTRNGHRLWNGTMRQLTELGLAVGLAVRLRNQFPATAIVTPL